MARSGGITQETGGSKRTKASNLAYTTSSDTRVIFNLEIQEITCPNKAKKKGCLSSVARYQQNEHLEKLRVTFQQYNLILTCIWSLIKKIG